jgi:RNA polymerase-binding transcription factor DksA
MRTLEQQRSRLLADSDLLADEAASDPSSTRDGGKQAIEVAIGAREDVQVTVQLIDAALAKLAGLGAVPYGICEETGEPIERERLDLMPWTPVSVRGARLRGR